MRSSTECSEATPCQASTNRPDEAGGERDPPHECSASRARALTPAKSAPVTERGRGRSTSKSATTRPGRGDSTTIAVGEEDGLLHVVGHEQDGARVVGERGGEPLAQVRARDRVERPEGLVEQQHRPALQQRAQEGDALAHAARQRRRAGVLELGQAEALEERDGGAAGVGALDALALERQPGVAERVAPGQQQVALGHVGAGGAALDHALVRLLEAGHQLEQCRLAAARGADHGGQLAGAQRRGRCSASAVSGP